MSQINQQQYQTATQGQTVFNLSFTYIPATSTLRVYVNGSKQILTLNYLETSPTQVTFISGLDVGDIVEFISP
jgi:hypothetical protein